MEGKDIIILGIESSCDDTSAAVIRNGVLLSSVIASQAVHEAYGGVVPELASRAHQQNIVPVVHEALKRAGVAKEQLSAVAFTRGPGLMGSLLVGVSFAKGFARALGIPMIDVNHLQGHVLAHFIKESDEDTDQPKFPFICLLVSGGNSQIIRVNAYNDMQVLGQTIDDAAGEAIDKCSKVMGLGYPGGPIIDKLARQGNPNAYTFGDTKIFITVTSGLIELLGDGEELDAVIAHECGHILCRHVLYHSIADYILRGVDALGILGALTVPIQYAILYWQRKSELSCDRVGSIITSPEVVSRTMGRLSGGPKSITAEISMAEWAKQADVYDSIRNDGLWNKALQIYAVASQSHPFSAVRVREIIKWGDSVQYQNLMQNLHLHESGIVCPRCHKPVDRDWRFCRHCGMKL